jgi:hypothetical protein
MSHATIARTLPCYYSKYNPVWTYLRVPQ